MVGWHHRLNGHEFEQTPGDGEGQGSLVSCGPWGCRESDMTKSLNNSNANGKEKNAGVAILVSEEVYFKTKDWNKRKKKGHYRRIKGSIQQEDTFVDISAPTSVQFSSVQFSRSTVSC